LRRPAAEKENRGKDGMDVKMEVSMKKWLLVSMAAVLLAGFGCASAPPANDENGGIQNQDENYPDSQDRDNGPYGGSERGGY
jgi:hypothetical protein